jgi:hypothetical protein
MPKVVDLHNSQIPDLERSSSSSAHLSIIKIERVVHPLLEKLLLVEFFQHNLRTVSSSL